MTPGSAVLLAVLALVGCGHEAALPTTPRPVPPERPPRFDQVDPPDRTVLQRGTSLIVSARVLDPELARSVIFVNVIVQTPTNDIVRLVPPFDASPGLDEAVYRILPATYRSRIVPPIDLPTNDPTVPPGSRLLAVHAFLWDGTAIRDLVAVYPIAD